MRSRHSEAVIHNRTAMCTAAMIVRLACCLLVCLWMIPSQGSAKTEKPCPSGGEHEYSVRLVRQATADKEGLRIYTCKKCGYSYKEAIPKTGHNWTEWKVKTPPTSKTVGIEERRCIKCGIIEERYMKEDAQQEQAADKSESDEAKESGNQTATKKKPGKNEKQSKAAKKKKKQKEKEKSKEKNKKSQVAAVGADQDSNGGAFGKGNEPVWNIYNTAVAAGGSLLIAIMALAIYNMYLVPWLWIRRRQKRKQQEVLRRMNI